MWQGGPPPPVWQGDFIFGTSAGFGVVANGNVINRLESGALYECLTRKIGPQPTALTKKGKPRVRQPSPIRDEPASFYDAQCLLYGVPRADTREKAKENLLKAFKEQGGPLTVPKHIIQQEESMKKEYAAGFLECQWRDAAERQRRDAAERDRKKSALAQAEVDLEAFNSFNRKRVREESDGEDEDDEDDEDDKDDEDDEDEDDDEAEIDEDDLIANVKHSLKFVPKNCVAIEDLYPAEYTIMLENFGWDQDDSCSLSIAVSAGTSHLWGSFDLGVFEGVLRGQLLPDTRTFQFTWRGRDTGTNEMTFIPELNFGELTFLHDYKYGNQEFCYGWIAGDCFSRAEIYGRIERSKPYALTRTCPDDLQTLGTWKSEWRTKHYQAHHMESIWRWGRRYGGEIEEIIDESDTSYDSEASESESENDGGFGCIGF
ncbi:hypothetical protein DFS34DRAFT_577443 [Phlyctochytrium arcticum]|nr:hypothetical protein DFS34DRAFT_577443 [Phlyctochytrium arcticum]